jgi:hypothetical protein
MALLPTGTLANTAEVRVEQVEGKKQECGTFPI